MQFIAWQQQQTDVVNFLFKRLLAGFSRIFFFFNKKPAKIFMGDVGSLSIGGGLAAVSMVI